MSRRSAQHIKRPRCRHHAAIWDEYERASKEYYRKKYDRTDAWTDPGEPPTCPDGDAIGYCDACRAELFSPGAVWPAEVWEYFHASCGGYTGAQPIKPYLLPKTIRPRSV